MGTRASNGQEYPRYVCCECTRWFWAETEARSKEGCLQCRRMHRVGHAPPRRRESLSEREVEQLKREVNEGFVRAFARRGMSPPGVRDWEVLR